MDYHEYFQEVTGMYFAPEDDAHMLALRSHLRAINDSQISPIRNISSGQIEYDSSKLLGKGSRARSFVYKGKFENRDVAVKRIPCADMPQMNTYLEDFKTLLKLSDKPNNLVNYYACVVENDEVYIAMELCRANLKQWRNGEASDVQVDFDFVPVSQVLSDVTEGLEFLHGKSVIHGDLKPSNSLVCQVRNKIVVKLADFGISQTNFSGTKEWSSPEILQALYDKSGSSSAKKTKWDVNKKSSKADIFSLGLIFYWTLTPRKHPFGEDFVDREYNLKNYNLEIDQKHFTRSDLGYLKLINEMIAEDPTKRPDIEEVRTHFILWSQETLLKFVLAAHDALKTEMVEVEEVKKELENEAISENWIELVCPDVRRYLESSRGNNHINSIAHLCLVIKNFEEHYQELPEKVREALGPGNQMLKCYWLSRFPYLIQTLLEICKKLKTTDNKYNLNQFYENVP